MVFGLVALGERVVTQVISFSYIKQEERHYVDPLLLDLSAVFRGIRRTVTTGEGAQLEGANGGAPPVSYKFMHRSV